MKNKSNNWLDDIRTIFQEQKEYIEHHLELSQDLTDLFPEEAEFIVYLATGMKDYFANYNFYDEVAGTHLLRYFLCKRFYLNYLKLDKNAQKKEPVNYNEYYRILDEANEYLSPVKKLVDEKNKRRTYDVRLFELAKESGAETKNYREALLTANKELQLWTEKKLIDELGKETEFFLNMIEAFRQDISRTKPN